MVSTIIQSHLLNLAIFCHLCYILLKYLNFGLFRHITYYHKEETMNYLKKGPAEILLFKKDPEAHTFLTRVTIPAISNEIFKGTENETQWIKISPSEVGFTEQPPTDLEIRVLQENFSHWKITYDKTANYILAAPRKME
jgi:hypothetical protein